MKSMDFRLFGSYHDGKARMGGPFSPPPLEDLLSFHRVRVSRHVAWREKDVRRAPFESHKTKFQIPYKASTWIFFISSCRPFLECLATCQKAFAPSQSQGVGHEISKLLGLVVQSRILLSGTLHGWQPKNSRIYSVIYFMIEMSHYIYG